MARRYEAYKIQRGDDLGDPELWNDRFNDLDVRIHANEQDRDALENAVDALEAVALQRLDETLTPIINDALAALENIGVAFQAESNDTLAVATGEITVIITPETRGKWILTDTLILTSADGNASMLGQPSSYDRTNGILIVDIVATTGTGPKTGWSLGVSAPLSLDHATRTDNPHMVTAAQVGAYTTTEVHNLTLDGGSF